MNNIDSLKIYRKRLLPYECLLLKDDVIVSADKDKILTRWHTINPKTAFDHGSSCYLLKEGIKISKFYRSDNTLLYWYCDIVEYKYSEEDNSLTATDLLADVIIYPDGRTKVVDLDEFEEALENGSLTLDDVKRALRCLDKLLNIIYEGSFDKLTDEIEVRIR